MPNHGASQDPLNYLIRTTKASPHIPEHLKRHILNAIKKAKQGAPDGIHHRIALYHAMYSHREMMRVQALIDDLNPTTTAYKNAIFALCKLTENYRRSLSGIKTSTNQKKREKQLRPPPTRTAT